MRPGHDGLDGEDSLPPIEALTIEVLTIEPDRGPADVREKCGTCSGSA